MTGKFSIIVPEATTNLVENPSFELSVGVWVTYGTNTRARSTEQQFFGNQSIKCTYQDNLSLLGMNLSGMVASTQYRFSAYVYIPSGYDGGAVRITDSSSYSDASVRIHTDADLTKTDTWQRIECNLVLDTDTDGAVAITLLSAPTAGKYIYVDAVQVEAKAYATTYCDGAQAGCEWTGERHNSTSTRDAQSRKGGRVRNLDDFNLGVTGMTGLGMPPLTHQTQQHAQLPGASFDDYHVEPRVITITGTTDTDTEAGMYTAMTDLVNLVKPDRVKGAQPFILRYEGTTTPVEIECYLDDGPHAVTNQPAMTDENWMIRLIGYSPFWEELGETSQELETLGTDTYNRMIARIAGAWTTMGDTSATGEVRDILVGADKKVYVAGSFTDWATNTAADGIVRWTPAGGWTSLGSGLKGGCYALEEGPDGTIYATGPFTTAGTTRAWHIAQWDGAKWSTFGMLTAGYGYSLHIDAAKNLWVGGSFHTAGNWPSGQTLTTRVARYNLDDGTWHRGHNVSYELNGTVQAIGSWSPPLALDMIYFGGSFTQNDSAEALNYVAKMNRLTENTTSLGSGLNNIVYDLSVRNDGRVIVCGAFTKGGGNWAKGVAEWTGTWHSYGQGLQDDDLTLQVVTMAEDSQGRRWFGGAFNTAGSLSSVGGLAMWNNSEWERVPVIASSYIGVWTAIAFDGEDVYIGGNASGTLRATGLSTSVINVGTASGYPRIEIKRAGGLAARLFALRNDDTGDELHFDYPIGNGETITIDLNPELSSIKSDLMGDIDWILLPGSDWASFRLLPGTNQISCLVMEAGSPTVTAHMTWKNRHWAVHGAD